MAKAKWMGQTILFKTHLPRGDWAKGRDYFFMQDADGTIHIVGVDDNGYPSLS